jgi:hypothetical protein
LAQDTKYSEATCPNATCLVHIPYNLSWHRTWAVVVGSNSNFILDFNLILILSEIFRIIIYDYNFHNKQYTHPIKNGHKMVKSCFFIN